MKALTKPSIMLLGIINNNPINPYEIIKQLKFMNTEYWFYIANSTIYATLKSLEKSKLVVGKIEKSGSMPDKTIYSITDAGLKELKHNIRQICNTFDYDTTLFSIAINFIEVFDAAEKKQILFCRLGYLEQYLKDISKKCDNQNVICQKLKNLNSQNIPHYAIANTKRMKEIVKAEIIGLNEILSADEKM